MASTVAPDQTMIDSSSSGIGQKRTSTTAGYNPNPNNRPVKRRASKACQCCRARKVRCNVVEHGAPCTNCRLDEVECIITESKRRKKAWNGKLDSGNNRENEPKTASNEAKSNSPGAEKANSPGNLYQRNSIGTINESPNENITFAPSITSHPSPSALASSTGALPIRISSSSMITTEIPNFVKPSSAHLLPEDMEYLSMKGALSMPIQPLRTELIECYFTYVHPYMPLIEESEFREIISKNWDEELANGEKDDRISLFLFQAMLFAGSAFAPMESLRLAGYSSRRNARKAFFSRARLLYDFDWERDRIALIQSLLLLTYWYETPDDQKDTWHWMGVAISLSHTIGLHRNPETSSLETSRQRLWKRIWWSCFMRDRLVALGMRRPTRIKFEDCDVPMLKLSDFGLEDISESEFIHSLSTLPADERRKQKRSRQLATLCIEKAKLCVIISNVLATQYSVFNSNSKDGLIDTTRNTMVMHPKKSDAESCDVRLCDDQLSEWQKKLSPEAIWRPANNYQEEYDAQIVLHRNLLHMVYFATLSALHRPQVLPSAPAPWPARNRSAELQEISRKKVRQAAQEITRLAEEMIEYDLVKYLPTVGVTVMLPALIIHLLDVKSSSAVTRELSMQGFSLCMQVMQGLRENYAAADFATQFLEAAVKKADIQIPMFQQQYPSADAAMKEVNRRRQKQQQRQQQQQQQYLKAREQQLRVEALSISATTPMPPPLLTTLTPPPDQSAELSSIGGEEDALRVRLESFLSASPPNSLSSSTSPIDDAVDLSRDFDNFIDSSATSPQEDNSNPGSLPDNMTADKMLDDMFGTSAELGGAFDPFLGAPTGAGESGGLGLDITFMSKEGMNARPLEAMDFDFDKIMENLEGEIA